MITKVEFFDTEYNVPPHKFEAGTPNIEGAVGLHAALDYLDNIGLENIHAHDTQLVQYAKKRLGELNGIRILAQRKNGVGW